MKTYGLAYYVEVDAESIEDAIKKSKKYLAPAHRKGWEPCEIQVYEGDEDE